MLKVRLQGTKEDINWFYRFLKKQESQKELTVLGFSDFFENKGTQKYYRVYAEVNKKTKNK